MVLLTSSSGLPPGWEEAQAEDGSSYYIHHETKKTTWERPLPERTADPHHIPPAYPGVGASVGVPAATVQQVPVAAAAAPPPSFSLATGLNGAVGVPPTAQPGKGGQQAGGTVVRSVFWIAAGLGWLVWVFAVAASSDEDWANSNYDDTGFGAGTDFIDDNCASSNANESSCAAYECFYATQVIAALMCSLAVVLFTVACFRPFEAPYGSTRAVGLVGGVFMALFALFQMIAFSCLSKMVQEHNEEWDGDTFDFELGATFGVGVTGFLIGLIDAIIVLALFRRAGNGPLFECCTHAARPQEQQPTKEQYSQSSQPAAGLYGSAPPEPALPPTSYAPSSQAAQPLPPPAYEEASVG